MGCDIHAHLEVKLISKNFRDQVRAAITDELRWHYYSPVKIERNYEIFAKMAGVRNNGDIEPIAMPRGIPDDISLITRMNYEQLGSDGHSYSWLDVDELIELKEFYKSTLSIGPLSQCPFLGVWVFRNEIDDYKKYPDEFPPEVADIRLVFWFDN